MSIKNSRPAPADPRLPATDPDATHAHLIGLRQDGHYRGTTATVVALTSQSIPGGHVDVGGTRLRLRALHVMGHSSARIARAVGVHPTTIRAIVRGGTTTTNPQLRDAITDVYDAWWDKRAPARTRSERGAATAARKRAIAGDWCAAAALDDDLLDVPGYQPRWGWKPATGTGTAPDIYPPALQKQRRACVPDDERFTWDFILEVLDVLERHGYRGDNQHTDQAVGLVRDVAHIYEGTLDAPRGAYVVVPSQPTAAEPSSTPGPHAIIISASERKTIVAALDEASLYKRDRAETCADCTDQSCATCQWRLQNARDYDQLAAQLLHLTEAFAAPARQPGPGRAQPQAAPDPEAGQ
jgi:hypothetical protein